MGTPPLWPIGEISCETDGVERPFALAVEAGLQSQEAYIAATRRNVEPFFDQSFGILMSRPGPVSETDPRGDSDRPRPHRAVIRRLSHRLFQERNIRILTQPNALFEETSEAGALLTQSVSKAKFQGN